MPATTIAGGMAEGVPDVCLVLDPPAPPIPTPFPNLAQVPMSLATSPKVLIQMMPAVVQSSQVPMSQGDEAGVGGGVMSGMNMGPVTYKTASSKVKAAGQPVVMLTSMTAHNGISPNLPAGGAVIAPSQMKVLVGM
jgi:hypothetical protein